MDTSFGILGTTAMRIGGKMDDSWGGLRERRLLAALLANPARLVPIETVAAWIWDHARPVHPTSTFHTYATGIRKALERIPTPTKLRLQNGHFSLELDKNEVDHLRFRDLLADARVRDRSGDPERAASLVRDAVTLWRGEPLADLATARADAWRESFVNNVWLPANALLVKALLATERPEEALDRLDDLQGDHAHNLQLITLRMSALDALDRSEEIADFYLRMHRHFREDGDPRSADRLRAHYDMMLSSNRVHAPAVDRLLDVGPPRQLLHDIPDFTGRDRQIEEMDRKTTTADGEVIPGVVIVDGMPGVGKTAFVTRWAHRARDRFPRGDLFIAMNGFSASSRTEQSTVIDEILIALGQSCHGSARPREKETLLRRALAGSQMLVVLDNVGDATQVASLVPLFADCLVIITSRHRLGSLVAGGARRVYLEPMTDAEGTELLVRRLGARSRIDRKHQARMVKLCSGLPLAIELLADHVARSPAAELSGFADRLDPRQLVTEIGEHGDGTANLRALFSWSYLALGRSARRLFRLLALHPGPDIGIDAVRACDGRSRAEAAQGVSTLMVMHLLAEPEEFGRFRYHDLIREFALECAALEEGQESVDAVGRRVLRFYLDSANNALRVLYPSELTPPDLPGPSAVEPVTFADAEVARSWMSREKANLIAAVRHSAYHGRHDALLWRLADVTTTWFDRRGFFESSAELRRLAVTAARGCGDRRGEASSLTGLAMVLLTLGEHGEARTNLEAALRVYEEIGGDRGMAATLHQMGRVELHRGDPLAALDHYRRSLALAERAEDQEALCWVHRSLGEAYQAIDQSDQALEHLHQAKWLAGRTGDRSGYGSALAKIGSVYRNLGDLSAAAAYCGRGLAAVEDVDTAVTVEVLVALAEINLAAGKPDDSVRYAQRAVLVCGRSGDVVHEAQAREVLGDAQVAMADLDEAVTAWHVAADLYGRLGNPLRASLIRVNKIKNATMSNISLPEARGSSLSANDTDGRLDAPG